jgi:hypothetical protein
MKGWRAEGGGNGKRRVGVRMTALTLLFPEINYGVTMANITMADFVSDR